MTSLRTTTPASTIAPRDTAMIYAILATGTVAAIVSQPALWLITPLAGLLMLRASKRAAAIVEPRDPETGRMSMRVELAIHDAVAQLPTGEARTLLGDVVRQARPLFAIASSNFDAAKNDEVREESGELVLAACDTALELSRLDTLLAARATAKGGEVSARDADLYKRYAAARTLFAARLTDAANAFGDLYASGVEHGTPASDRVAELVIDLKADAAARSAAKTELDQLLSS